MEHSFWGHLPLLLRANSKESVEYILQALWRTQKTGLDAADRQIICEMLQLQNDADLDPLLVCLRMLIRRCVYENTSKEEIQKLFPNEVLPELQRLLTILLQKFQKEWRQDISKNQVDYLNFLAMILSSDRYLPHGKDLTVQGKIFIQVSLPGLKAMTWNMVDQEDTAESTEPVVVINLQLQNGAPSKSGDMDVKFQLAKDTLETMVKSMYSIRDQLSDVGGPSDAHLSQ